MLAPDTIFTTPDQLFQVEAWRRAVPVRAGHIRKSHAWCVTRHRTSPELPWVLSGTRPFETFEDALRWVNQIKATYKADLV